MTNWKKKGLSWMIFKWFGPSELKDLVKYIAEVVEHPEGTGDIALYPLGEFVFNVKTSMQNDLDPIVFPTPQERSAFNHGLNYGVQLMGGSTTPLTQQEYEEIEKFEQQSPIPSNFKNKMN